jgi:hypothetical protein
MPHRRPSRLAPSFERVEPRVAPSVGIATPQEPLNAILPSGQADTFELLELVHQVAREQRASTSEPQLAARNLQMEHLQVQADNIREAAQLALAAGIVSGVSTISSGVGLPGLNAARLNRPTVPPANSLSATKASELKQRVELLNKEFQDRVSAIEETLTSLVRTPLAG